MTTPSRLFRQFTRGLALVGLLFFGLAVLLIRFPMIDASAQQAWIKRWSIWVSRTLGLKLQVRGQLESSIDSALIVANHSSWLDIVVINSIQPSAFIAKAEIEKWPIVGLLVARSGTLFIERGKRHAVHKVLQQAVERLQKQGFVAVFPEGTTNDGTALLPFHGNLMEAAIRAEVPVQPLAIAYRNSAGMLATTVEFIGETTFVGSMLRVLGDNDLHVMVHIARAEFANEKTRHELANHARVAIASALGFE
jgi:1-acyl-sn-glycerol-3-phosphate acyltransferase